ncbi:MAG: HAMP domain-containing protein [Treponema sp.]|nr:HAMP domain-containing protein [Treponema sp.]
MKIRLRIILVVLPVVIVALTLAQAASYFSARSGITRIAQVFFNYKSSELEKYAIGQWALLTEYDLTDRPEMVEAAKNSVLLYAEGIILSDTEIILSLDNEGNIDMATSPLIFLPGEVDRIMEILHEGMEGIFRANFSGRERVFTFFYFSPFDRYILVTEDAITFYREANRITYQTIISLLISSAAAVFLLIVFARHLIKPLERVARAMDGISRGGELSSRVEVEYPDETGELSTSFNMMVSELETAYSKIKRYAFDAVLAGKKEQRIRRIFQKYVPKEVIDRFFASPDSMLVGENRELAVLFSDIRSFTTISERMAPDDLVSSLNRYFSGQVDIIMNRNGIIDKYIGDAIMAFWGAPVMHSDDALQSLLSGLEMVESINGFNEKQRQLDKPEFHVGIGISYGTVTVGNIGSERKMDYTVIGDMVNLASRMEGLTKIYNSDLLISESLYEKVKNELGDNKTHNLSFRLLDTVAVKGKTKGVKIYTVKSRSSFTENEEKAWAYHNKGMELYYKKNFNEALRYFNEVIKLLPGDFNGTTLLERCKKYSSSPPPPDWIGVEKMETK